MMLGRLLVRIVAFSHRNAWLVVFAMLVLTGLSVWQAARTLDVDTDESDMLSQKLEWRQREIAFYKDFPGQTDQIVVVIDGADPDQTETAARKLTAALSTGHPEIKSVRRPDGGPYFVQHGLLLLPIDEVKAVLDKTIEAQPLLGTLAADPSPRGLFSAVSLLAQGVARGETDFSAVAPALKFVDDAIKSTYTSYPQPLAWQTLLNGRTPGPMELQHVILVQPVLDPGTLQPGGKATSVIRDEAIKLGYNEPGTPRIRLTGQVPLADEEFASAAEGALAASVGSLVLVIVWLLMALRSVRLIAAIVITLVAGFALTAGFAALAVGTLNLISIAFAVLFIGLAVDFSIQYSVRYRDERYREPDLGKALQATAASIGTPIAVAALATAAGFYSFLPTAFKGVSELGKIAGTGMLIAFACNMTVLPASLTLFRPKAEQEPVGYRFTAPVDAFLKRQRWPVIILGCGIAVVGAIMLPQLHFDFDPLHVKNQKSESVSTLNDLMNNPLTTPYSAEILEPSLDKAVARAAELEKLPDVLHALTLASFIPEDQDAKRALVADAANFLLPTLEPPQVAPAPTPEEVRQAIAQCRAQLEAALAKSGPNPTVSGFIATLKSLETAPDAKITQLTPVLISSLPDRLQDLKDLLEAPPVTVDTLPADIRSDWIGTDGKARIEVYPKGDARQNSVLKGFFKTIERVAPDATGSAITIQQSANTIVGAFKTAGLSALAVIAIILAVVLRNAIDVALVLGPLLLAALMTVIVCVAWPYPLNFANIIALPLLLGIGVAFDIYFVMNWRKGQTLPLQSPTARAVLFSALTTGTAFGSLALSHHPGTASMGVLLIISLIATLFCTLIVLPSLLAGLHGDKHD